MADPTTQPVHLGTVAIEPRRWARDTDGELIVLSAWLDAIAAAGFDGIELWERHFTAADPGEQARIVEHELPVPIFNSYASLDEPDPTARVAVAATVAALGSTGVKFNVGNEPDLAAAYTERIAAWVDVLPADARLLCECHHGISIAEDPLVAASIFDASGVGDRLGAIVHTHEDADHLRARFDAYGDRITHVHVNFLDFTDLGAPRLRDITPRLQAQVGVLQSLGYAGSWTIEFCHGLLTDDDVPEKLVAQAVDDLAVLREVIG